MLISVLELAEIPGLVQTREVMNLQNTCFDLENFGGYLIVTFWEYWNVHVYILQETEI